ncbi:MAG: hypothetical protein ACOYYU_02680 [Chloroflexota bacterium]
MQDELLKQAARLIRSGQTQPAKTILEGLLKTDPKNITAWFWYAEIFPTVEQRIRVLETCQRFNAGAPQVQQALDALRAKQAREVTPAPAHPQTPSRPPVSEEASRREIPANQEPSYKNANQPKRRGTSWFIWALAGLLIVLCIGVGIYAVDTMPANPADHRFTGTYEYYLYAPKAYTPDRAWPVFIGIHGAGGSGLDCWNWWQSYAEEEGFILVCPSIPNSGGGWYQEDGETALFWVINQVRAQYHTESRYFLAGFSAGATFVEAASFRYPRLATGVAILSAGTFYPVNLESQPASYLVVIGGADDPTSVKNSRTFASVLEQNGFSVEYHELPGVGHTLTRQGRSLTIDHFRKVK